MRRGKSEAAVTMSWRNMPYTDLLLVLWRRGASSAVCGAMRRGESKAAVTMSWKNMPYTDLLLVLW
jgi:hypothetical protein